ncbi:MAG: PASTA domain-containing protein, partial [Actinobacteria bacterium]|nr:PASTA domain-containing protein [Actinomycetota bacterium]
PPPSPPPPPPPPPPPAPPPAPPAARCVVPSLRGKTLPVAVRAIARARCRVGAVSRVYSAQVKKGRVVSQSRRSGLRLPLRSRVSLVVSRGPR